MEMEILRDDLRVMQIGVLGKKGEFD